MFRLVAVVLLAGALATACGEADSADSAAVAANSSSAAQTVASSVTNRTDAEPSVRLPEVEATDLAHRTLTVGTGAQVAGDDWVLVEYVGRSLKSQKTFDSSWKRAQPTYFGLDQVITGWREGLVGMTEGERRELVIPADKGYGANPPENSPIAVNDTLVYVVDLLRVLRPPEVVLPDALPESLVIEDLIIGTGPTVNQNSSLTVHYSGVAMSSGAVFDSSWDRNAPESVTFDDILIEGWTDGLANMKVGGRRQLVVPPELAFGEDPPPDSDIASNDTLVFVVDLLAVTN